MCEPSLWRQALVCCKMLCVLERENKSSKSALRAMVQSLCMLMVEFFWHWLQKSSRWMLSTQWMISVVVCGEGGGGGARLPFAGLGNWIYACTPQSLSSSSSLGQRLAITVTVTGAPRQTRTQIQQRAFHERVVNSKGSSILRRCPLPVHAPPFSWHYIPISAFRL